jgi:hypothetical protein
MNPNRIYSAIALFVFLALTAGVSANDDGTLSKTSEQGPVQLTTSVDRTTAQIAEPVTLTITATAPQGVTLNFPQVPKTLGECDVVGVKDMFDIPVTEGRQWTRTYRLESLVSGDVEIPPVAVAFTDRRDGEAKHDTIQSQPIRLRIASVLEGRADPLKFCDIKTVVEVPAEPQQSSNWVSWMAGGAGTCALAGLAFVVWTLRRREPSADRWALVELQHLEDSPLRSSGDFDELYFRLTLIVRGYVERRFGIAAPKWTTVEFMERLRIDNRFDALQQTALGKFLTSADLIKFACAEPSGEEVTAAFTKARDFIHETMKLEKSQPVKEAA